jgi:hypothetical protein
VALGALASLAALAASGCGSTAADSAAGSAGTGAESGSNPAGSGGASPSGTGGAAAGHSGSTAIGRGGSGAAGTGSGGAGAAGTSGGVGTAGAPGLSCPAVAPTSGATCSVTGVCNYLDCAGAGQTTATCDGAKFSVATAPCQSTPCGMTGYPPKELTCMPNEICVEYEGGNAYFACQPDPCAPNAQACGCAATLCGATSTCSFQNSKLVCACAAGCA